MNQDKTKGVGIKPGAHPTAPGGMSQKALLTELVEKHNYTTEEAHEFKPQHMWGRLVEQVVVERMEREKEAAMAEGDEPKKGKKGKKGKKAKGKKAKADTPLPHPQDMDHDDVLAELADVYGMGKTGLKPLRKSKAHAAAHLVQARRDAGIEVVSRNVAVETDPDDDLAEADTLLAEADEEIAAPEPERQEKVKRTATKAEAMIEDIEAVLTEPEPSAEVEYAPVKEYQRKPAAASMAKFPHIHLKGVCIQNLEGAPCEVQALTMETIEHANSMDLNEVAVSLPEDIDILAFYEEMDNERAVALAEYEEANPPLFIPITGVKDFVFDGHMGAGPSGAERWMNCTGSLDLTRRFLETLTRNQQAKFADAGIAARQGTVAHAAAETQVNLMLGNISPEEAEANLLVLATEYEEEEAYDEEMAEWITQYTDLVKQYVDAGHNVLVEARVEAGVPLPEPLPNGEETYWVAGSADFIALPCDEEPTTLTVGDLKYGDGVWVEVDENPQVRIYALGALAKVMDEDGNLPDALTTIEYQIIQPRLGGIKTWSEPIEDLLAWREAELAPALMHALRGMDDGATLVPGEQQCQWCPVRGNCPALAAQRMEQAQELFTDINEEEIHGEGLAAKADILPDDKLGRLLGQVNGLVNLQKDLKAEVERRLHRGRRVPGFNLVNYTPPRRWHDDATEKVLKGKGKLKHLTTQQRALLFKPETLVTPKQAIEVLAIEGIASPEEVLGKLYDTPEVRPVVGPEGDRRKLWAGKPPEQMFPDLADDE